MKYFVVVSYDIPDDKRRKKLSKELKNYGNRVQYSVFECNLTESQINDMRHHIAKIINQEEDSIKIYVLDNISRNRSITLGNGKFTEDDEFLIF